MTTIASIQGNGWSVVGYDSRVSEDDGRYYTLPKHSGKVVSNSGYLLGAAGDMRAVNILTDVFKPPPAADLAGVKLDKFMTSRFIPELKSCFEENNYGKDGEQESSILVSVNGVVYDIGSNYEWCHDEYGVYGLGSGGNYALGCLYSSLGAINSRTIEDAKSQVRDALTIAARLDHRSGAPFNVLIQKVDK
jgi:ATP-dependent protease HslVU (ClpYQ) peptidase subunit